MTLYWVRTVTPSALSWAGLSPWAGGDMAPWGSVSLGCPCGNEQLGLCLCGGTLVREREGPCPHPLPPSVCPKFLIPSNPSCADKVSSPLILPWAYLPTMVPQRWVHSGGTKGSVQGGEQIWAIPCPIHYGPLQTMTLTVPWMTGTVTTAVRPATAFPHPTTPRPSPMPLCTSTP